RQEARLGRAALDRIGQLDEIDGALALDDALELGQRALGVVRDAEIADAPVVLHPPHAGELRPPIDEVVDLHEIDDVAAEERGRPPHLLDAALLAGGPYLGGEKDLGARAELGDEIAGHAFGAAVHRRAVDHAAAAVDEALHHLAQRLARRGVAADIEGLPGAEPDHRHGLAAPGDGA